MREAVADAEPGTGFAAEREADVLLRVAQPHCAARPRLHHRRQALGKDAPPAGDVRTSEAAGLQMKLNDAALPRQIGETAPVVAMKPHRPLAAQRAGGSGR